MDTCLVTGGAGFIGSHIADALVEQGYRVVVLDDLSRGKRENINSQAKFCHLDIRSPELATLLKDEGIDFVFHTAAQVDVQVSLQDPIEDAGVNIVGTLNLLEACRRAEVKKVIYSSSAAVYGEPRYLPLDEKHPISPCSGYGISKYTPELYLKLYRELYGLDYTILRYANVYGPRQDVSLEGGVVAIFINLLEQGRPPVIYGDGEQTRDFIFVADVVSANLASISRGSGAVFNIGTGRQTSVNRLCRLLNELFQANCQPLYHPKRDGDIRHCYLRISQAKQGLAWEPRYDLSSGLGQTIGRHCGT